jgi:MATE family multidrug resistance protein
VDRLVLVARRAPLGRPAGQLPPAGQVSLDSMALVFAHALRGAGDTRFVSLATLVPAVLVLVLPVCLTWRTSAALYWAWGFATAYVCTVGCILLVRFLGGTWKTLSVIQPDREGCPAVPGSPNRRPAEPATE